MPTRSHLRRAPRALAAAAALSLLGAAPAAAQFPGGPQQTTNPGTVTMTSYTGLAYTARSGQANDVSVAFTRDAVTLRDEVALLTAGSGCQPGADLHEVRCARDDAGISSWGSARYTLTLGDGDDTAAVSDDSVGGVYAYSSVGGTIDGGLGNDVLRGGDGSDTFRGGPGADVLDGGGGGNDVADYGERTKPVTVTIGDGANDGAADDGVGDDVRGSVEGVIGGAGNDTLTGDDQANVLTGGPGADVIEGGDGDDTLAGSSAYASYGGSLTGVAGADGGDDLRGGAGNDRFTGGDGADVFHGGAGSDTVSYEDHGATTYGPTGQATPGQPVTASIGGGGDDGNAEDGPGGARDAIIEDVEAIVGTMLGDTLVGDADSNRLDGAGGADTLDGGDGADALLPGYDGVQDQLTGGPGDDVMYASSTWTSNGSQQTHDGSDTFDGGAGTDRADYSWRSMPIAVTLDGTDADDGAAGEHDRLIAVEGATGGEGNDTLTGTAGPNRLHGGSGAGDDVLHGLDGDDRLFGGSGYGSQGKGDGADTFDGGAGDDELQTRDARVDTAIVCGPGDDLVRADEDTDWNGGTPVTDTVDASCEHGLAESVSGTGTVSTDDEIEGVTPFDPTDTTLVHPDAQGAVAIDEHDMSSASMGDWAYVGQQVQTDVGALAPGTHATVELVYDASVLPSTGAWELTTGGTPVPTCVDQPSADACLDAETTVAGGDLKLTVQTTRDSWPTYWQLRVPKAGRVFVDDGSKTIRYSARDGEVNVVKLAFDGSSATLTDDGAGAPLVAGPGCTALAPTSIRCTYDSAGYSYSSYDVALGDGADTAAITVDGATQGSSSSVSGAVRGGPGDDVLQGGSGSDTFDGGPGADVLDGGDGLSDTAWYGDRTNPVVVTVGDGADDGEAGEGDEVRKSIEDVTGGAGDDTLTGSALGNELAGGGGDDKLSGGAGQDRLDGDATYGTLSAPGGTPGDDWLDGGDGNDSLTGGRGGDEMLGGEGSDRVSYADHGHDTGNGDPEPVEVLIGDDSFADGNAEDGPAGFRDRVAGDVEGLEGSRLGDTLTGNARANRLDGGDGADTLRGGDGADTLRGGYDNDGDQLEGEGGDDTFDASASTFNGEPDGGDTFSGGAGTDLADYSSRQVPVTVTLDDVADDGAAGEGDRVQPDVEAIQGGSKGDTLVGTDAPNRINGGSGSDTITGLGGDDTLTGGFGYYGPGGNEDADTILGGDGQDTIRAQDGAVDTVDCGPAIDVAHLDDGSYPGSAKDAATACENVNPSTVVQAVEPGETAGSLEVTEAKPVGAAVTSPVAGNVTIQESVITQQVTPPAGTELLALQMNITAPDASVEDPLRLTFSIASSLVPAGGADVIKVFRNGAQVADACVAAEPGDASQDALPDPCIAKREVLQSGAVRLTVLSSHASEWNFAAPPKAATPPVTPAPEVPTTPTTPETPTTPVVPGPSTPATPATPAAAAPGPAPAKGKPAPADLTAPVVKLATVKAPKVGAAVKTGVVLPVTCSERCTVTAKLVLDAKTAKKLKLPAVVGTGSAAGAAGPVRVTAKLSAKAKGKLRRQRTLKLRVELTVTDAAGNAAKVPARTLTLRR